MPIHTSKVTTANNGDLTIQPNGTGDTKLMSVTADNPGQTLVAVDADKKVKKLDVTSLGTKSEIDDDDWVIVHDSTDNKVKKIPGSELGGKPFDPTPSQITAEPDFVAGDGSEFNPYILTPATNYEPGTLLFSQHKVTISGGSTKSGKPVMFTDVSAAPASGRFTQSTLVLNGSGEASFYPRYFDTPTTAAGSGQTYNGKIKIGETTVWLKWDVTQVANATNVSPKPNASPLSVDSPTDGKYGTGTGSWADGTSLVRTVPSGLGGQEDAVVFAKGAGAFDQNSKSFNNGDVIKVGFDATIVAAASDGDTISGALTNDAGYYEVFSMVKDTSAASSFTIEPRVDQEKNAVVPTVNSSQIFGINAPATVTNTAGSPNPLTSVEVSVNGGAWTSSFPVAFNPGDRLQARGTTGGDNLTPYTTVFTVGGTSATFSVTTSDVDPEIGQPGITSPANGSVNLQPNVTLESTEYNPITGSEGPFTTATWQVYEADVKTLMSSTPISNVNPKNNPTAIVCSGATNLGRFTNGDDVTMVDIAGDTASYVPVTSTISNVTCYPKNAAYFPGNNSTTTANTIQWSGTTLTRTPGQPFTLEWWWYPTTTSSANYGNCFSGPATYNVNPGNTQISISEDMRFQAAFDGVANILYSDPGVVAINDWNHLVVVRDGSAMSAYVNGNRVSTTGTSNNVQLYTMGVAGGQGTSNLKPVEGYVSNVRYTEAALYNASQSTVPVTIGDYEEVSGTKLLFAQSTDAVPVNKASGGPTLSLGSAIGTGVTKCGRRQTLTFENPCPDLKFFLPGDVVQSENLSGDWDSYMSVSGGVLSNPLFAWNGKYQEDERVSGSSPSWAIGSTPGTVMTIDIPDSQPLPPGKLEILCFPKNYSYPLATLTIRIDNGPGISINATTDGFKEVAGNAAAVRKIEISSATNTNPVLQAIRVGGRIMLDSSFVDDSSVEVLEVDPGSRKMTVSGGAWAGSDGSSGGIKPPTTLIDMPFDDENQFSNVGRNLVQPTFSIAGSGGDVTIQPVNDAPDGITHAALFLNTFGNGKYLKFPSLVQTASAGYFIEFYHKIIRPDGGNRQFESRYLERPDSDGSGPDMLTGHNTNDAYNQICSGGGRYGSGYSEFFRGVLLNTNQWYKIQIFRYGDGKIEQFVDGVSVGTATSTSSEAGLLTIGSTTDNRYLRGYLARFHFGELSENWTPDTRDPDTVVTGPTKSGSAKVASVSGSTVNVTDSNVEFIDNTNRLGTQFYIGNTSVAKVGPGEPSDPVDTGIYTTVTPSSTGIVSNKAQAVLDNSNLNTSKAYYSRVKHADNAGVESEFSSYNEFTTKDVF